MDIPPSSLNLKWLYPPLIRSIRCQFPRSGSSASRCPSSLAFSMAATSHRRGLCTTTEGPVAVMGVMGYLAAETRIC